MAEEIKSIFKSRNYWMAFAISFLTLLGYSLSSWLNAISVGESMEYRESALSLSVGGIFFGGFMLLFPFCASVAHATSQVDELQSGMARWRVMRGSVARYVGVKAAASMLAAALATTSAFALHAVIWNGIALPCDPAAYAVHTIYFSEEDVYKRQLREAYDLTMKILKEHEMPVYDYLYELPRKFSVVYSANPKTNEVLAPAFYNMSVRMKKRGPR